MYLLHWSPLCSAVWKICSERARAIKMSERIFFTTCTRKETQLMVASSKVNPLSFGYVVSSLTLWVIPSDRMLSVLNSCKTLKISILHAVYSILHVMFCLDTRCSLCTRQNGYQSWNCDQSSRNRKAVLGEWSCSLSRKYVSCWSFFNQNIDLCK